VTPACEAIAAIDVEHLGTPNAIAAALWRHGDGAPVLVDPGPGSTYATLRAKLDALGAPPRALGAVLLTHIHLDHAGAAGHLVAENPALPVYVHTRGARHMADPSRLLASATRLYGEAAMALLWGEMLPVPEANLRPLEGGERLSLGGATLRVAYTPGHASHHVAYLDEVDGVAFTGDTAGCRVAGAPYVLPPTPPPDFDLEAWLASAARIRAWGARAFFVTHFGLCGDTDAHLDELEERLQRWVGWARERIAGRPPTGAGDAEDAAKTAIEDSVWFAQRVSSELREHVAEAVADAYERGAPPATMWSGIARYLAQTA
jgi:glyoxylase-like metal-dependent hydrolase (beta-lactamase superfamily II)